MSFDYGVPMALPQRTDGIDISLSSRAEVPHEHDRKGDSSSKGFVIILGDMVSTQHIRPIERAS